VISPLKSLMIDQIQRNVWICTSLVLYVLHSFNYNVLDLVNLFNGIEFYLSIIFWYWLTSNYFIQNWNQY
jgi:hypothetical protein